MIRTQSSKISVNVLLMMVATSLVRKMTSIYVWSVFLTWRHLKREVSPESCKCPHRRFLFFLASHSNQRKTEYEFIMAYVGWP